MIFHNVVKDARDSCLFNVVANNQHNCTINNTDIPVSTFTNFSVDECNNFLSFYIGKKNGLWSYIIPTFLQHLASFHLISLKRTNPVSNMKTVESTFDIEQYKKN